MTKSDEKACKFCEKWFPNLALTRTAWAGILRSGPSRTFAVAEIVSLGEASRSDAEAFVDHLRACIYSWPIPDAHRAALKAIDLAFADALKPEHFTRFDHCDECRQHDETLRSKSRYTITLKDLGIMGWEPIGFSSPEGVAYYFPALARYALQSSDPISANGSYEDLLVWHLANGFEVFREECDEPRRAAVRLLLKAIAARQQRRPEGVDSELATALKVWDVQVDPLEDDND